MPQEKKPGRARVDLKPGPLGPLFFDAVAQAAAAAGETFSDYIRRAVLARMKREGRPFEPEPQKGARHEQ